MKALFLITLALTLAQATFGRAVRKPTVPQLFELASLAVTGEVTKVEPTGIETSLSYPTLNGIAFQWLRVTCKVGTVLKGKYTAENISVGMLAVRKSVTHEMFNGPLMLEPKVGANYAMFLAPSSMPDFYVSLLAPYDESNAIFSLDRKEREYDAGTYTSMSPEYRKQWQEKKDLVWSLTSWVGGLSKSGAEEVMKQYRVQIAIPGKAVIIPLEWKKHTNTNGWSWDVPKDTPAAAPKAK